MARKQNVDESTVEGFGLEWSTFTNSDAELPDAQRQELFERYFHIFPWDSLPRTAIGIDVGCGSGRWALIAATRVQHLHLVDASEKALQVARRNLAKIENVSYYPTTVDRLPFPDRFFDFAYSLGVLHHIPDPAEGIRSIARTLKPGGIFLLYMYYAFDNRPYWYQFLWNVTNLARLVICRLPYRARYLLSQLVAAAVYWPLARAARLLAQCSVCPRNWPLRYYADASFYVMRTDALDRLGTRIEHRFTRDQIRKMLVSADFERVQFSESAPYWCALAYKR